jgi:hypothetical protein
MNRVTAFITALVFITKSFAYLFPIRTMDRLRAALFAEAATLAYIFTALLLRFWGVLPPRGPLWEAWADRVCLIAFGVWVLFEMARAGVLRKPKAGDEG